MSKRRFSILAASLAVALFASNSAHAAFLVEQFNTNAGFANIQDAINAINGVTADASAEFSEINFSDFNGATEFGGDNSFLLAAAGQEFNPTHSSNETFVVRITGTIFIANGGVQTLGVRNDDGLRLLIDGGIAHDDPPPQAPNTDIFNVNLAAGFHDIELVMFENFGNAQVEFFSVDGNGDYHLIQAAEVPEPSTIAIWSVLGFVGVGGAAWRRRKRIAA